MLNAEKPSTVGNAGCDTINLLDYLELLVRRKVLIVTVFFVAFVLSIGVTLLLPNIYSSTAMILPPQQDQSLMGMMLGQMGGGMASLAGDLLGKGSSADTYVSIMGSNAVSDTIIDRFNLMQVYKQKYRVETYKKLEKNVEISTGKKDGIISVTVEDEDPKRAADMANAYVDELGKLTVRLNMTGAGENKSFLKERLAKAKTDLANAEDAIKAFQAKNKIVSVTDQAGATITGIAQIKAQLVAQEVQLAALRRQFTDNSTEVKTALVSVENLRRQIASLEGNGSGGAIPKLGSVPEMGQQYLRLMREFKIQEALVELLTKQYELANLNQAKDVTGLQIIQKARVPDKKVKPKRGIIVIIFTFAASFLAVLYVFAREAGERLPEAERERLRRIRSCIGFRR